MRVLVVAPEIDGLPRLASGSELTRLGDVAGVEVHPLTGPLVTQDRIQSRLRQGRFGALLWSGHGAGGRLLLPGGNEIEPRWLASELKRAGVTLAVLVDRGGRQLPIEAAVAAARITLPPQERLSLARNEQGLFTFAVRTLA
jgi:hypothetical protein